MNKNVIDLVSSAETENEGSNEEKLQELALETLQKFDLHLGENKKEIRFVNFDVSRYQQSHTKSVFGEKQSLSYMFHFMTYNLEYVVKLLAFQYDNKMEVLKLDIEPQSHDTKKELEYCCNYLKRRRNLNLMFGAIVLFSRFIEARRLICDLILKKCDKVSITKNKDGGIIVVYDNELVHIKFGIIWNIVCNYRQEITDVVEIYYRDVECPNKDNIKQKLIKITHPNLSFTSKYHIWRELFQDLNKVAEQSSKETYRSPEVSGGCSSIEIMDTSEAAGIVLVSDSEDSGSGKSVNLCTSGPGLSQTVLPANVGRARTNFHHVPSLITNLVPSHNQANGVHKDLLNSRAANSVDCDVIPAKKCKKDIVDDDLEITSITFVVPD